MKNFLVIVVIFTAMFSIARADEFASSWVSSINMPPKSRAILIDKVEKYSKRAGAQEAMRRMAHLKPAVDDYCLREGIHPEPIYGLILTESQARPDAVDGVFRFGRSRKAHVGLGQLNFQRLPKDQRFDPDRIQVARRYQMSDKASDKNEWENLDKRFDSRWNLKVTIHEFHGHLERTGDPTLSFMGHHGGGNDPVKAVQKYARDREVVLTRSRVPSYVKKHKLNYFVLYESPGSARRYWASKSDCHLSYGFAPVVWSELFARWCVENNIPKTPATSAEIQILKGEPKVEQQIQGIAGWIASLFTSASICQLWADTMSVFSAGLDCAGKWAVIVLLPCAVLVGLRHIIPPFTIVLWAIVRWGWRSRARPFRFVGTMLAILFGTKARRIAALKVLKT